MLRVEKVDKKYDNVEVLFGVDLCLNRGKIHGLIGENGAGKTTLIKCMSGIYRPDGGCVISDNMPVYDNPAAKNKIAYVSDSQEIMGMYSVRGLVKLYKKMYEDFSVERFLKLNEKFQISIRKNLFELSKGQKMSLAFMLAIARNADYLIMDEPLSGLDARRQKQLLDVLVNEVETREIGVLLSSHNLEGLEKLCDEITMLQEGKVILQKTTGELWDEYQNWQFIADDQIIQKLQKEKCVLEITKESGKVFLLVTKGNFEENRKMLERYGGREIEQRELHLEKLFLIISDQERREGAK